MESLPYELVSGKKLKSVLLYVQTEKQLYKIKSKTNKKTYYVCYAKNCLARVELLENGICCYPKNNKTHNHENQEAQYKEILSINGLREDCLKAASVLGDVNAISGIRSAFKRALQKDEESTKFLNYEKMKRGLQYLTSKSFAKSPKSALEVIEAFKKEEIHKNFGMTRHKEAVPFFKACIVEDNFSYCIFFSEKIVNIIREYIPPANRDFLLDGTFKIIPQGCFKQLLIIYIDYFGEKVFPFIYVLMDKRTSASYNHLFNYINNNVFKLEPNSFLTDFESALQNSLKNVFPGAKCFGCWFHFCQALRRNLTTKHKDLAHLIRINRQASLFFHKLLAMALLPDHCIESAFTMLKAQITALNETHLQQKFLDYFEKQWLKKVGPKNFSVFKKLTRTTSDIEAYNGVLGRMIPKTGNFFKFVKVIQDEEFEKSRNMMILIESGGAIGAKHRKKTSIERSTKIMEASVLLENGSITSMQFLDRMVYPKNTICTDMEPVDDLFEDPNTDELESEEETLNYETAQNESRTKDASLCIICSSLPANIVLLPCKHMQICSECNLKIQAQSLADGSNEYLCPVCRQVVVDTIQVFVNST